MADGTATKPLLLLTHKMLGHTFLVLASVAVFAEIDFNHTITLGSILIALVIAGMAGFLTIRSKIATVWREEAEGERAAKERLQDALSVALAERAEFEKAQAELRHGLKNENVALQAQLQVLEAKTDLTGAVERITATSEASGERVATQLADFIKTVAGRAEERDAAIVLLLQEIRDKLPSEPIAVREIDPTG